MKTLKPLTKKQKQIIVAAFIGQLIAATDDCMFGDSPNTYILESDQEDILEMIKSEGRKHLAKAESFSNIHNVAKLIKIVREAVK